MTRVKRIVVTAAVMLLPSVATAQGDTRLSDKAAAAAAAPANLNFIVPMGGASGNTTQVILDVSRKEKVGTAAIGWQTGTGRFQLAFSGPLDDDGAAEPISLTGLGTGATAKLSFNKVSWRGPNVWEREKILEVCRESGFPHNARNPTPAQYCNYANILKANPNRAAAYRELMHLDDRPWIVGGDITAGQVTQKFLTPLSLVPGVERDVTWAVSGRAGVFIQALGFLVGSYSYGETLKPAAAASQVCRPIAGSDVEGALSCGTHVIGLPIPKTASVVGLELRRKAAGRVAWSPNVQVDLKESADGRRTTLVEVPIYFLSTGAGASPSGGVRFAWRSDQKELTAVIFLGGAFQIFD
jgi:hypothetical protein